MNAQDILKDYQTIRDAMPNVQLPALNQQTYHVEAVPKVVESEDKVLAAIDTFNPISGWIGYQSDNQSIHQEPLVFKQNSGVLLNAELTGLNNTTLHVRYNGNSGWILTHYTYQEGGEFIADTVLHYATKDELGKLNYLRFWKAEEGNLGLNPVYVCFTGFGG